MTGHVATPGVVSHCVQIVAIRCAGWDFVEGRSVRSYPARGVLYCCASVHTLRHRGDGRTLEAFGGTWAEVVADAYRQTCGAVGA